MLHFKLSLREGEKTTWKHSSRNYSLRKLWPWKLNDNIRKYGILYMKYPVRFAACIGLWFNFDLMLTFFYVVTKFWEHFLHLVIRDHLRSRALCLMKFGTTFNVIRSETSNVFHLIKSTFHESVFTFKNYNLHNNSNIGKEINWCLHVASKTRHPPQNFKIYFSNWKIISFRYFLCYLSKNKNLAIRST